MTTKAAPPTCPTLRKPHKLSRMTRLVLRDEVRYACLTCDWDYVPDRDEWTWQGAGPAPAAVEGKAQ